MSQQDTLTIIFADVCRSTQIFEEHGDIKAREIISNTLNAMEKIVVKYGGRVVKTIGDEIMCTLPDATAGVLAGSEMQRRTVSDLAILQHNVNMRVGLHYGSVISEDGDVFGDAVNVAARMAGIAKAQQVVTTQSTLDEVDPNETVNVRSLGKTRVKGKLMPIDIVDILWQEDTSNVTTVSQALKLEDIQGQASIVLHFKGKTIEVKDISPPFMMGRDLQNDLILDDEWVSRNHASIEFRKGYFILADRSTNGTYLKSGNDAEFRVHQDEMPLRNKGTISLGQTAANRGEASLIRYECDDS